MSSIVTDTHALEALKNSEHHVKIDSITNKIGSDALSWNRFGQLTQQARAVYEIKDDEVKYELERLNSLIESREPTWWEEFKSELNKFVVEIVRNMPPLAKGFLGGVLQTLKFLGLPRFFKPTPQLSPFENDV